MRVHGRLRLVPSIPRLVVTLIVLFLLFLVPAEAGRDRSVVERKTGKGSRLDADRGTRDGAPHATQDGRGGQHRDDDREDRGRIRLAAPASVTPVPFDPTTQASVTLSVTVAVKPGGIVDGDQERDDDDPRGHRDREDRTRWFLHLTWRIAVAPPNGIATVEKDVELVPPFRFLVMRDHDRADRPKGRTPHHDRGKRNRDDDDDGKNGKRFLLATVSVDWNGRSAAGCVKDGSYPTGASVQLVRVKGTKRKIKGSLETTASLTVAGSAPVLTITSPADRAMTRELAIDVAGSIGTLLPASVTVGAQTLEASSSGAFLAHVPLDVEGDNVISVTARDCGGRSAAPRTLHVLRDRTPPVLQLSGVEPGAFVNTRSPAIRLSYQDAGSGPDPATVVIIAAGTTVTDLFDVASASATLKTGATLNLPDGPVRIEARCADRVGNVGTTTLDIFVDTVKPVASVAQPPDGSATRDPRPLLKIVLSDAAPSSGIDVRSLAVFLGATDISSAFIFTVGTTEATATPQTPLEDQLYRLTATARDRAGNVSDVASASFLVDRIPPVLSLNPADGGILTTNTPDLVASFTDPGSGVASFTASINGVDSTASFHVESDRATFRTPAGAPFAEGSHSWSARAVDRASNAADRSAGFVVDTRAPVLEVLSPLRDEILTTTAPHFQVRFQDPSPGSGVQGFKATLDSQDVTGLFTTTGTGASFQVPASPGLTAGPHEFVAEASDRAGHTVRQLVSFSIVPAVTGPTGILAGRVLTGDICNNQPLAGAAVRLIHSGGVALTDAAGRFTMPAPIGLVWAEVAKAGFLSVQRSAQVVEGQTGALPTVFLASQDPKVTRVIASQGGIVTDSTGDAILELPPFALPRDTDVVMTIIQDKKASKGPPLRNFIPGVAVRLLPERLVLNAPATVRVKNRLQMPVHPIFSFDWNQDTQVWERTAGAQITPDGQFFQSMIDHFSNVAPG